MLSPWLELILSVMQLLQFFTEKMDTFLSQSPLDP